MLDDQFFADLDGQIRAAEHALSFWVNQIGLLDDELLEAAKQAALDAQLSLQHLQAAKRRFLARERS